MSFKKKEVSKIIIILLTAAATLCCGKSRENIVYKEIKIQDLKTDFIDRDTPNISYLAKTGEHIVINTGKDIWAIDLKTKKSSKIIDNGVGPDQAYYPFRVAEFNGHFYINSLMDIRNFYKLSNDSGKFEVSSIRFNKAIGFDDFALISKDLMAAANVNWEDGYIRLYDLKTWEPQKIGKKKLHPLMLRFNVNKASLCLLGEYIYVAQNIKPEIQVVSLKTNKISDFIKLSPPFYKPMPEKYDVEKYNNKKHKEWMAGWLGIFDLLGKEEWIIIKYRWGYEEKYCYELFNTKNRDERFYIAETQHQIYDFEIDANKINFEIFTKLEEETLWQKASALLY
jgi:hypothetical protein